MNGSYDIHYHLDKRILSYQVLRKGVFIRDDNVVALLSYRLNMCL